MKSFLLLSGMAFCLSSCFGQKTYCVEYPQDKEHGVYQFCDLANYDPLYVDYTSLSILADESQLNYPEFANTELTAEDLSQFWYRNSDGQVLLSQGGRKELEDYKLKFPNTEFIVTLEFHGEIHGDDMIDKHPSREKIDNFVKTILDVMEHEKFGGLCYSHKSNNGVKNKMRFVNEILAIDAALKEAMDISTYIFIDGTEVSITGTYPMEKLKESSIHIVVHSTDVMSPYNPYSTPLRGATRKSMNTVMSDWMSKIGDPSRLFASIDLLGLKHKRNGSEHEILKYVPYEEICMKLHHSKKLSFKEDEATAEFTFSNGFITFENVQSCQKKAEYIELNRLGGLAIYSYPYQGVSKKCPAGEYVLHRVLKLVLSDSRGCNKEIIDLMDKEISTKAYIKVKLLFKKN